MLEPLLEEQYVEQGDGRNKVTSNNRALLRTTPTRMFSIDADYDSGEDLEAVTLHARRQPTSAVPPNSTIEQVTMPINVFEVAGAYKENSIAIREGTDVALTKALVPTSCRFIHTFDQRRRSRWPRCWCCLLARSAIVAV